MRILAVADDTEPRYYEYYKKGCLDGFDMILSCGDLSRSYLEFLVTMANCPLVYVHGNHDDGFLREPPEGCLCADGKLITVGGLRILGLGGSFRYNKMHHFMYTEREMQTRALKLWPSIAKNHGFDILLTHAPALGINDFDSVSHRGFETFNHLIEKYEPKLFIHGHIHKNYGVNIPTRTEHGKTCIINACKSHVIEI